MMYEEMIQAPPSQTSSKPQALTVANLEAQTRSVKNASKAPSVASKKGKKGGPQKPAWAQT